MQQNPSKRGPLAAALAWAMGAALLAGFGCATPPDDPAERAAYDEANDPLEPFNRFMFDVSMTLDKTFFRPVAKGYRDVVPDPIRDGVTNFLRNARSPLILINDVLQGELYRAGVTLQRFALNSTFGFGGIVDLAKLAVGLEFHDEDFGQTLAVWGAGEGFYLFVPLKGPSSMRDAGGGVVDGVMDPASLALEHYNITYGPILRTALTALDERSRSIDALDDVERTSIDFYAALRSLWRQKREDEIRNGRPAKDRPAPTVAQPSPTQKGPFEEEAGAQAAAALPRPSLAPVAAAPAAPAGLPAPAPAPVQAATLPVSPVPAPPTPAPAALPAAAHAMAPAPASAAPRAPAAPARPACALTTAWLGSDQPVGMILFKNASAALAANDRALIQHIARLAKQSGATIRVIGHADEATGAADAVNRQLVNFDFSSLRAETVATELGRAGMPAPQIVVEARSDQEPLCPVPGEPANRRVNLYLSHGPSSRS